MHTYIHTRTNLGTFGTIGTLHVRLFTFLNNLFESRDLRDLVYISLNLTIKLVQFLGPSVRHIYDYLFKKKKLIIGTLGTFQTYV